MHILVELLFMSGFRWFVKIVELSILINGLNRLADDLRFLELRLGVGARLPDLWLWSGESWLL